MTEVIVSWFSGLPVEMATFILAMIPVTELRASIPVAVTLFDMSPFSAFFWSVLGNCFVGVVGVYVFEPLISWLVGRWAFLGRLWEQYVGRIRRNNEDRFAVWGAVALVTFVAIPLPLTGIFTGAVAASIFKVPPLRAIPLLCLGSAIAGILVTLLTVFSVMGFGRVH
ncbi:MAG: small multi-drug export protein [Candidatus Moranbacteria bacterium]|nr:small multi-drug export protein [Candidatus Moranbacteria bacterium]